MALTNGGFETEDPAAPGFADDWTLSFFATAADAAGYDDVRTGQNPPFEAFERGWDGNESAIFEYADPVDPGELEAASYDDVLPDPFFPEDVEDFEEGWDDNEFFEAVFSGGDPADYDTTSPESVEDFEEEWDGNESFLVDWAGVVAGPGVDPADYDTTSPESVEDFEEEWDGNEAFLVDWDDVVAGLGEDAADYDTGTGGSPESVEDFEEVLAEFSASFNPATDTVTKTAHGMTNGQRVTLRNEGGDLPAGLNPGYVYFVVSATANTFQLAATSGGAAINFTDAGHGIHYVTPDGAVFWTGVMTTL